MSKVETLNPELLPARPGPPREIAGTSRAPWEGHIELLEPSASILGTFWELLGAFWDLSGAFFWLPRKKKPARPGPPRKAKLSSGSFLDAFWELSGSFRVAFWEPYGSFLGTFWELSGRLLGTLCESTNFLVPYEILGKRPFEAKF